MKKDNLREMIISLYSSLIKENITKLLESEDTTSISKISLGEEDQMKVKLERISKDISVEFADEVIKRGFPDRNISEQEIEEIIRKIIEKNRKILIDKKS